MGRIRDAYRVVLTGGEAKIKIKQAKLINSYVLKLNFFN